MNISGRTFAPPSRQATKPAPPAPRKSLTPRATGSDWFEWLAVFAIARATIAALVPVTPEEAYHWNYAMHPDWGYFDHPPMIAWSIAAGTWLFGNTAFGIRFVPILFGVGTAALLGWTARRLYGSRAAVMSIAFFSMAPLAFLVTGAGFPDAPLMFFWSLTLLLAWRAIETDGAGAWISAGAAVGAAMMSKYTAVFLPAGIFLYLVFSPEHRRRLASPWPYLACIAGAILFAPVLYWNATHDWASFRFQGAGRLQEASGTGLLGGIRFVGQQWLAVLPLTLPLAAAAAWRGIRSPRPIERYLVWCGLPMLAFFFAVSWTRTAHLLWPLAAYLGAFILMGGAAAGGGRLAAGYRRGLPGLAGATAILLLGAAVHLAWFLPWFSPFKGLYGWEEAAIRARAALPEGGFYVGLGRKYTCASELAFHIGDSRNVHGKNVVGLDGLQYAYWSDPEALRGRDAVIVATDEHVSAESLESLRVYFRDVEKVEDVIVPVGRSPILAAPEIRFVIYRGRGYIPRPPPSGADSTSPSRAPRTGAPAN